MQKWRSLLMRSFREASVQIWRNKFLSGTSILLGALIIFLLNFVFAVQFYMDYSLKNLESRADFSVKLREGVDAFEFDALKNELSAFRTDLTILKSTKVGDIDIPERLHIQFHDLHDVGKVFEILKKTRYDSVIGPWDGKSEKDFVVIIDRLLKLRENMESASVWLIGLFIAGGVLITLNTFRMVLFTRKEEIFIARLSGAELPFISWPFLFEGIILGIFSSIIAILIFVSVLREIDVLPGGDIFLYFWNSIFSNEIVIAGGVGGLGAWISIKKYLRGKFS